jgi:hypothetical protein
MNEELIQSLPIPKHFRLTLASKKELRNVHLFSSPHHKKGQKKVFVIMLAKAGIEPATSSYQLLPL